MNKYYLFFLILFNPVFIAAQSDTVKNLVFAGAGIRGIAYTGAVKMLDSLGKLDHLERVGGTSAGAIIALAISLDYSPEEIEKVMRETSYEDFNDGDFFLLGGIYRLTDKFGWYEGKVFHRWVEMLIKKKTGKKDLTFRELKKLGHAELYVTATSLNKQKTVVLSHETYPDMNVSDAVRISMSIPLFYTAVAIDSLGNIIDPDTTMVDHHLLIDGGVKAKIPIHLFDSTKYVGMHPNTYMVNPYTLCVKMEDDRQIEKDKQSRELIGQETHNLQGYVKAFYTYVIRSLNRSNMTEADWVRTLQVPTSGIEPFVRRMKDEELEILYRNGLNAVTLFYEKKNSEEK